MNRLVRITQRVALNDPYEFHPTSSDIFAFRGLLPHKSIGNYDVSDQLIIDQHLNCVGVISFTEEKDNLAMWSHYANEHRGMVVEFDPRHPFFSQLQRVDYSDRRRVDSLTDCGNAGSYFSSPALLAKSTHWSYEKEWRIVDSLIVSDCLIKPESGEKEWSPGRVDLFPWEAPGLYMKQVPAEAIMAVVFGCRADDRMVSKISASISDNPVLCHVKKYRVKLKYDEYKLEFVEF